MLSFLCFHLKTVDQTSTSSSIRKSSYKQHPSSQSSYAHFQYYYTNPNYSFGYSQPANLIQNYIARRNHMPTSYASRPRFLNQNYGVSSKLSNSNNFYSKPHQDVNAGFQIVDHSSYHQSNGRNGNYLD